MTNSIEYMYDKHNIKCKYILGDFVQYIIKFSSQIKTIKTPQLDA